MELRLNLPQEYLLSERGFYKEFYGKNTEQMHQLMVDDRTPMNTSQLMQRRLEFRCDPFSKSCDDAKSLLCKFIEKNWERFYLSKEDASYEWGLVRFAYLNNSFDTGDALVLHPNGNFKIILDSRSLREITPDTIGNAGTLKVSEDIYDALKGKEFNREIGWGMSREDVKAHSVWKVLARDQGLLDVYANYIFAKGKKRVGYDNAMGIFPLPVVGDTPEIQVVCISGLGNQSGAEGVNNLCCRGGRFVGIASEVLSASR